MLDTKHSILPIMACLTLTACEIDRNQGLENRNWLQETEDFINEDLLGTAEADNENENNAT